MPYTLIYRTPFIRAYDQYDTEVPEQVLVGQFHDTNAMYAFFKSKLEEWRSIDELEEAFGDLLELGYYSKDPDDYYFILKDDMPLGTMCNVDISTIPDSTIREIERRMDSRKLGIKYRQFTTVILYYDQAKPYEHSTKNKMTVRGFPGDMRQILLDSIETEYKKKIIGDIDEHWSKLELYYEPGYSRSEWWRKMRELEINFTITGLEEPRYTTLIPGQRINPSNDDDKFTDRV